MGQIIWSIFAEDSLSKIWSFYAEVDEAVANKIVFEIFTAAENIKYAKQFQREELLFQKYRRLIVRHFKIIYREEKDIIRIIDVFDTRQNPEKIKRNK